MRTTNRCFARGARMVAGLLAVLALDALAADQAMTLKVATLAPKGSIYHRALQDVGEKWRSAQGPGSRYIVYTDGVQGGEANSVRRMRVGQLNAALLSVVGLVEIDPSLAALQNIPLMFRSWDELDYVREKLRADLESRLHAKGFVVLLWGEGGWVQFFGKAPHATPEEFKAAKIFAWAGDNPQVEIMKSLGYRPVVLEITDILPSLQTGMIDMVPAAPVFALAGQFDRAAPYMLKINWAPIVGALVMTTATWEAMSPQGREALMKASAEAGALLRSQRDARDAEIIRAMESRGLKVISPTPEAERAWREFAQRIWPRVRGNTVPTDMFDRVEGLLAEYRGAKR